MLDAQALYGPAIAQMLVDNLVEIGMVDIGIPSFLRIDHQHGAFAAAIQAAGIVDAHLAGYRRAERLDALLDVVARFLGEERPLRFIEAEKPGFFKRLFGGR